MENKTKTLKGVQNAEDLIVWQKAMHVNKLVYRLTKKYPADERFILSQHTRKTSISVISNISEGWKRRASGAARNHFDIALGSLSELETQLYVGIQQSYFSEADFKEVKSYSYFLCNCWSYTDFNTCCITFV